MSRLTKKFDSGVGYNECHGSCMTCNGAPCELAQAMIDKLANYEDLEEQGLLTIISNETFKRDRLDRCTFRYCNKCDKYRHELQRYKGLEEHGKLIELPCSVGDTVWLIGKNYNKCTNHYDCEHYDYDEYLIIWCEKNCPNGFRGTGVIQAIIEAIEINREQVLVQLNVHDNYLRVPIASVFLTKEEAETKLKEMEGAE